MKKIFFIILYLFAVTTSCVSKNVDNTRLPNSSWKELDLNKLNDYNKSLQVQYALLELIRIIKFNMDKDQRIGECQFSNLKLFSMYNGKHPEYQNEKDMALTGLHYWFQFEVSSHSDNKYIVNLMTDDSVSVNFPGPFSWLSDRIEINYKTKEFSRINLSYVEKTQNEVKLVVQRINQEQQVECYR